MRPVWGTGLRADDPRANNPCQGERKNLLGEEISDVPEDIRGSETRSAQPPPPGLFRTCTAIAKNQEISSAPRPGR